MKRAVTPGRPACIVCGEGVTRGDPRLEYGRDGEEINEIRNGVFRVYYIHDECKQKTNV